MQPTVTLPPDVLGRTLARLIESGGVILPDALYQIPEVARLIGRSSRTVGRLLEDPDCPLTAGLHSKGDGPRTISGRAILDYQASIKA